MSKEIKDDFEERFANNSLYKTGGFQLENAYKPIPRDTSDEAIAEWRNQVEYEKICNRTQRILRLTRPFVSYIAKYNLFDSDPQPMPEELIKAMKDKSEYQVKNLLEKFKRCKDAVRRTTNQYDKWLLQINEAQLQDVYEVCISFEPHTGGSKNSILRGSQVNRFQKETADKKMITEEAEKYYVELISAFEQELKERENPDAVKTILNEGQESAKEHKRLVQKVRKVMQKPIDALTVKDARTFFECRQAMSVIEDKLHTLENKFDKYQTPPETEFPSLANELTCDRISGSCYGNDANNVIVKALEKLYREIKDKEASKKA